MGNTQLFDGDALSEDSCRARGLLFALVPALECHLDPSRTSLAKAGDLTFPLVIEQTVFNVSDRSTGRRAVLCWPIPDSSVS